ncbi:MAG: DUF389 domain-containing protein [Eubacteriaceae bacterium]|nr:DUF389 domain-containing protein [Eubacteriaceae bacterium]
MIDYFRDNLLNIKSDQADANTIHESIVSGVRLKGAPLIILFCAIIVASIGLNTNSTAVVIGAMLISPIMNPIIAMGYSIAIYDGRLLRNAGLKFSVQIMIALLGATLYFFLSPIHGATSELIARTGPSFFDMLIAFFGGAAGAIGITRKEKTNVIPGVAIATALMPPLCTVGYGIANGNPDFAFAAAYLFAINAFFIMVATFLFCKLLQLKQSDAVKAHYNKIIKRSIIIGVILITIPAAVSAVYVGTLTLQQNALTSQVEEFIANEVNTDTTIVMQANVYKDEKRIRLDLIGKTYPPQKIAEIENTMIDYGLGDYNLEVVQNIETSLFAYFENINTPGTVKNQIKIQ